jgi:S1-C subfamily serine protease
MITLLRSLRYSTACVALCALAACNATVRTASAVEIAHGACAQGIPELFEKASPAVVMITGQSINPYRLRDRVSRMLGSGFIIDAEGLVLTNSPTVSLGDSDKLRPGEEVIAIGNPLGLDQTVTRGIVSGLNRLLPETPLSVTEPLIQTDTAINPGNSGGPLLNRCGEVIGITTAIVPEAQNIGFAIPINLAKTVLPGLLKDGHVIRPWIGFHGQMIGAELRKLLQMPLVDGLLVEVVEPGSPAEKLGVRGGEMELSIGGSSLLLGGDIVVGLNGAPMKDPEKLVGIMRGLKVGSQLKLRLFRQGKYLDIEYKLPERPLLPGDLPEGSTLTPAPPPGKSETSRRLRWGQR